MKKGDYKQWYTIEGAHLTVLRDSKFVNIFDNCTDQNKLAVISRRRKKKEQGRPRRWKQRFVVLKVETELRTLKYMSFIVVLQIHQ